VTVLVVLAMFAAASFVIDRVARREPPAEVVVP
jgi:hypothetical protein